jgi:FG-GAP repeat
MQRLARRILGLLLMGMSACAGLAAEPITPVLLTTFTNPAPVNYGFFGHSLVEVGARHVLSGVPNDATGAQGAGVAHMFSLDGSLELTLTNPAPETGEQFGWAMAVADDRWIAISALADNAAAHRSGAVHVFNTDGQLLKTITHPAALGGEGFGYSVAVIGTDRAIIGAFKDNRGAPEAGAVYVFGTNGALLTMITNPSPVTYERFGSSVAALGATGILIGSPFSSEAGEVYLYDTNGTLITTFTNPNPVNGGEFGHAVVPVGQERVLVSAIGNDDGAESSGGAYLFATNGVLLATLANPSPENLDRFGYSVAQVSDALLLVGVVGKRFQFSSVGTAYLYLTNGNMFATLANPEPESGDNFGSSMARINGGRVVVSAVSDDKGANDAGSAYVFDFVPRLEIETDHSSAAIRWIDVNASWHLQWTDAILPSSQWMDWPSSITTNGVTNLVQQTVPAGITNRFYRLRRP